MSNINFLKRKNFFILLLCLNFFSCSKDSLSFTESKTNAFDACVVKIKNQIENHSLEFDSVKSFLTNSINNDEENQFNKANLAIQKINGFLKTNSFSEKFLSDSNSHNQLYAFMAIFKFKSFNNTKVISKLNKVWFSYSLKHIIPERETSPKLLFKINSRLHKNENPTIEVSQEFIINDYEACSLQLMKTRLTEFQISRKDKTLLETKNTFYNSELNTIAEVGPKFISFQNPSIFFPYILKSFKYLSQFERVDFFSTAMLAPIQLKVTQASTQEKHWDTWINEEVFFNKIQADVSLANNKYYTVEYYYSNFSKDRFLKQIDLSGEIDSVTRLINKKTWKNISTLSLNNENKIPVKGLSKEDFNKDNLTYTISLSQPMEAYPDISSYGEWKEISSDNGNYVYSFKSLDFDKLSLENSQSNIDNKKFLKETKFYNFSDPIVQELIGSIKNQFQDIKDKSFNDVIHIIGQMIRNRITVDKDMVNDSDNNIPLTASKILMKKKGVCIHYSTLFVTLCRALGIPSRVVVGWLIDSKSIGVHAWVEILNEKNQWFPIEPQTTSYVTRGYIPRTTISIQELPVDASEEEIFEKRLKYNIFNYNFGAVIEKVSD